MEEEMKFMDYILPPLQNGKYVVKAEQKVTEPVVHAFHKQEEFRIADRIFSIDKKCVFAAFPAENEEGEFGDVLPFLVMDIRTFPWEYSVGKVNGAPLPWVCLIAVAEDEGAVIKELTVEELLEKEEQGVYFPDRTKLPSVFADKDTDPCRVLDLPRTLYEELMPSKEDLPYLCHARRVNLKRTEDDICAKDGYFSVVLGNRFIPSGETLRKSTIHLVSLLGMGDLSVPPAYETVRLVSLYQWDVFSKVQSEVGFVSAIEGLKENCGVIGMEHETEAIKQTCVLKHFFRTGEEGYSLYRSPLLAFHNEEEFDLKEKHTADGHLIYDRELGMFDVTYASAWQLGRMLALSHPADAQKIVQFRKDQKLLAHKGLLRANLDFGKVDVGHMAAELLNNNKLGGEKDEENENDAAVCEGFPSVFCGYR